MKVKLVSNETTFYKKVWESVIEINGKQVKVGSWNEQDNLFNQYDADHEIDKEDFAKLTEEEREVLGEYMDDILGYEIGKEWNTDGEEVLSCNTCAGMDEIDKKDCEHREYQPELPLYEKGGKDE